MIELEDVAVTYRNRRVLSGIDLAVEAGERVALIGPNGAGKSTLLRAVTGLVAPSEGSVRIAGEPLRTIDRASLARRLAVVPQQVVVPFSVRVEELVGLGRLPHEDPLRGARPADRAAVHEAIERVGIGHLVGRDVRELSLGERQLTLVALAVAQAASVLILDEPTVHLDPAAAAHVAASVDALRGSRTILLITHDPDLAARADRVLGLEAGRLVAPALPAGAR